VNPAAHDLYLLGMYHWNRLSKESSRRGREALERAVALDPAYAPAWAALAISRFDAGDYTRTAAVAREGCRGGLAAVERALALDPELARGYSTRAHLRAWCSWDWDGARSDIERAVALSPGDVYGQRRHGGLFLTLGRPAEAIPKFRKAIELDPLVPLNWRWLTRASLAVGDVRGAREALDRWVELLPGDPYATYIAAITSLLEGDPARALATSERLTDDEGRQEIVAIAAHSLGDAARSSRALAALAARAAQEAADAAYELAVAHAWRGERDRAFEWLERSFERHEPGLTEVRWDPLLRTLRGDPRYTALLRKMKLPVD
jgi:serine/threonine-protein kinase